MAGAQREVGRGAADRIRGRCATGPREQRRRPGRRQSPPSGRDDLHGQPDRGPGPRHRRRSRRRRRADRRAGRRTDSLRGGGRPPGHHQLRDHLRDLQAGATPLRMTLASRLEASPAVQAITAALVGAEGIWLVGGAVREAARGREVTDVDLAVAKDEAGVGARIAETTGGPAFPLSEQFGTWRVLAGDRSWGVDVTRLRGDHIEDDLAMRDFTVNALALPIDGLDRPPLDPCDGLPDLEAGVLRAVSERSFADDPLRVLRGARIAAALGFEIDPDTVPLARREAVRAGESAGERQFAELRSMITGPAPLRGLRLLDDLGATAAVLPELEALRGVEQN